MRDLIIASVLHYWDKYMFPGMTMKTFFVDIYKFLILLDVICLDDTHSIAIHSKRSKQWIALYLACYIKGVDFVVLSPNLTREKLFSTLNFISISYLFTEQSLVGFNRLDMFLIPFLKGAYDINNIKPISLRRSVYNHNIPHLSLDTVSEDLLDKKFVLRLQARYEEENQESCVINMTSGVSHFDTKLSVSTARSIEQTITNARGALPYNELHQVYSEVEFAHSHIVTVLLPFIKGCAFVGDADDATVIIESTTTFEHKWYEAVEYMFENKFLFWVFRQSIFNRLFNRIAGRMIKDFYVNVQHVIVYNGSIQERALNIAKKHLPLCVTYGSQESNQLMACNKFSALAYQTPGSVGRFLGPTAVNKRGELKFVSEGVFDYYLGDEAHTNYIRDGRGMPEILTGDHAEIVKGFTLLKGRITSVYTHGDKIINLDEIERHIRSLPYIEECVLVPWDNDTVNLVVRVNQRLIEAHKLGWNEATHLLDKFYKALSNSLEDYITLADVIISPEPFVKSFDGKIRTSLFRPGQYQNSL